MLSSMIEPLHEVSKAAYFFKRGRRRSRGEAVKKRNDLSKPLLGAEQLQHVIFSMIGK
jgi:hypothetical protein